MHAGVAGFSLSAALLLLFLPESVSARELYATPENYRQLVSGLQAGDSLRLAPGVYAHGLTLHFLNGTAAQPIVIDGAQDTRVTFTAVANRNTISIVDSSHVHIRNLVLEGRGLPVDAVKAEGHAQWAHHIHLEGLTIRGHGHDQQTVAISSKCPAWGWVVRRNVIEGAGTGMYFGNSDGRAPFIDGLIELNLITDTLGYNLQIKHQSPRPDLPGMPREKNATTIRHNVFSKARAGAAKEQARPNVLVGHWPLSGPGVDDQYLIYGNFFYQNPHEALFQGEGNIALYNNLLVNARGDAVRIQPHHDTPRTIAIFYNTVVASGKGIVLVRKEGDPAYVQDVLGNMVFAAHPGVSDEYNVSGKYATASEYLARPSAPLGEIDLTPRTRPISSPALAKVRPPPYLDSDKDFSGLTRNLPRMGAYDRDYTHPHWLPKLEIKP